MKKLLNLGLILSLFCYSVPSNANLWSMWEGEDEELETYGYPTEMPKTQTVNNQMVVGGVQTFPMAMPSASSQFNLVPTPDLNLPANAVILESQTYKSTFYPASTNIVVNQRPIKEKTLQSIDYDTLNYEKPISDQEFYNSVTKWDPANVNTYWDNYRGNNVRIELLKNNRDVKEMRLKFHQSTYLNSDSDGSISDMLGAVAKKVMKDVCGRKARQSIILYERPSVELIRETPASGYKVVTKGTSIKEYGFRCIY